MQTVFLNSSLMLCPLCVMETCLRVVVHHSTDLLSNEMQWVFFSENVWAYAFYDIIQLVLCDLIPPMTKLYREQYCNVPLLCWVRGSAHNLCLQCAWEKLLCQNFKRTASPRLFLGLAQQIEAGHRENIMSLMKNKWYLTNLFQAFEDKACRVNKGNPADVLLIALATHISTWENLFPCCPRRTQCKQMV